MREQLAVPKIGQCARLSLTVFELQMCKNYVTHIVPVPANGNPVKFFKKWNSSRFKYFYCFFSVNLFLFSLKSLLTFHRHCGQRKISEILLVLANREKRTFFMHCDIKQPFTSSFGARPDQKGIAVVLKDRARR